jgi:predicted RNA-binding protein
VSDESRHLDLEVEDGVFCRRRQMCEATVYLCEGEQERELMQDVVLVKPEGEVYLLASLLGEQKLVRARIDKIDFIKHTVHLTKVPEPSS